MIFVDTGAWYADFVPDDSDHSAARTFLKKNTERLVTTDHVIGETITLLRMRGRRQRAQEALARLLSERTAQIEWVKEADVREAFATFRRFSDKDWSFTDCLSYVVMPLGLKKAFAFDHHFRPFGTVDVLP